MSHHEIERTYALDPDTSADAVPDLTVLARLDGLPGVAAVGDPVTADLEATYVDTDDLALTRAGVSLRRRTGGDDEGWHLKLPTAADPGSGRDEIHRPLGATENVPARLARPVTGWTRGRALEPVAVVRTERTTRLLLDVDGATLAEVADDRVTGVPTDEGPGTSWRELEIELVEAGPDLLEAADALLAGAGIEPSAQPRKIAAVLAHRLDAFPPRPEPTAQGPARLVLHQRLSRLVEELRRRDSEVRRGVPDGVHQMRVTCRRLRAALATYRPLVDRDVTDPVRDELRWVARALGEGRDAEVVLERLRTAVDAEPRRLVVGPVKRRLDRTYGDRQRHAGAQADRVLTSDRYLRLLGRLEALVTDPPWRDVAEEPARDVLLARTKRDFKRLRRRTERALPLVESQGSEVDQALRDEALHDVRKAAKRLRYACEALEPVWGSDAKALRKAAQEITRVLGDRQDGVVALGDLRPLAASATAAGESAFTYGLLHAREEHRRDRLESELVEAWDHTRRKRLRRWLG